MRVIIVGSGIVGASCAYYGAEVGADVVLVDADAQGRATAAGAGIICPWSSQVVDEAWHSFAAHAARMYPSLIEALAEAGERNVGYRKVGALSLSDTEGARDEAHARILRHQPEAPEMETVRSITGAEAQALFPPLRSDIWAVHVEGAARVDGRLLSRALKNAAVRAGATALHGQAELRHHAGRVVGIDVGTERIEGDVVVAATGAWTENLLRPVGLSLGIQPQRGQIIHLSVNPTDTSTWPAVLPTLSSHYMLAFDDSRVVIGATREPNSGFDYRTTAGGLAEVLSEALSVAPGLASASSLETRVGFRPMGSDIKPLLGAPDGVEGLVIATGLGASGLTMGPLAGAVAARVATGQKVDVNLAPFDPLRASPATADV